MGCLRIIFGIAVICFGWFLTFFAATSEDAGFWHVILGQGVFVLGILIIFYRRKDKSKRR